MSHRTAPAKLYTSHGITSGELVLNKDVLNFVDRNGKKFFSLDEYTTDIKKNGAKYKVINTSNPKEYAITTNSAFIEVLKKEFHISAKSFGFSMGDIKKDLGVELSRLAKIIAVSIAIILVGAFLLRSSSFLLTPLIPLSVEAKLSEGLYKYVYEKSALRYKSNPSAIIRLDQKLNYVFDKYTTKKELPWKAIVIESDVANAFALPGGLIVFHSQLIKEVLSESELVAILAHEIAHIENRHSLKRIVGDFSTYLLYLTLFDGGSQKLFSSMPFTEMVDNFAAQSFSRAQETEADEFARDVLQQEGLDGRNAAIFFKRQKHKYKDVEVSSWLSSHPSYDERIELFENAVPEGRSRSGRLFDLDQLKSEI